MKCACNRQGCSNAACRKAYHQAWRAANQDSVRAAKARYRKKNRAKVAAATRDYHAAHVVEVAAYNQEYKRTTNYAVARRRYEERYPEKIKARRLVATAIRAGRLTKEECERYGADCRGEVQAHHDDYSKPLDVRWLCVCHHRLLDREAA